MEIKLVDNPLWKRNAVLWFFYSAIQFLGAGRYNSFALLVSGICGVIVGILFLTRMTNLTYLTLRNSVLTVHLQGFLGKKKIKYSEINKGEVLGKEIILHLENGRKYKLKNDWISYDDFSKLRKELESHSITFR